MTPTLADRIDALLPQTQCRRCGYDACRPYAEAIAAGEARVNRCPPGGRAGVAALAALVGVEAEPLDPAYGAEGPLRVARVVEEHCIGCTLCIQACPVDAIVGAAKRMHVVVASWCTGCELCVPPCPVDCIEMEDAGRAWTGADAGAARTRFLARHARLAREGAARAERLAAKGVAKLLALASDPSLDEAARASKLAVVTAALERARARRAKRAPAALAIAALTAVTLPAQAPDARAQSAAVTAPTPAPQTLDARIDAAWNYRDPAASETRLRAMLDGLPEASPERAAVLTQVARTHSLRREFAQAHAILDTIEPKLASLPPAVEARYWLERGRTFNSARERDRAVPAFERALGAAEAAPDDFLAVDALHMLGIAAPPDRQLEWNLRAIERAEASRDPRARQWLAALYNNVGWTYHDRGDYRTALGHFEKALAERERRGDATEIRIARWMIGRTQRSLGRLAEAEALQRALLAQMTAAGTDDGYVHEELAELALARGDLGEARLRAVRAHELLGADKGFVASEPQRLARLERLARGETP
jgi:electron transport complex protein RnfB